MKVKVGDKVYDSNDTPIMVILSDEDKDNISNMAPEGTKYCSFPDHIDTEWIAKWMS